MNAQSYARRSLRRVTDRAALRVLVNAQAKANELVRDAALQAESLRADAKAYVRAVTYEAAILHEEAATLRAEALALYPADRRPTALSGSPAAESEAIDLEIEDEQFDRYIDLDMGEDPAKEWILGSRS